MNIPTRKCAHCNGSGKETDHTAIGSMLRAKREKAKLSLRSMAGKLKVSAAYLSDLELGRRNWSDDRIKDYVKYAV